MDKQFNIKNKYLKYKNKYLSLKNLLGGNPPNNKVDINAKIEENNKRIHDLQGKRYELSKNPNMDSKIILQIQLIEKEINKLINENSELEKNMTL
jgi:hypothetical protein